MVECSLRSRRGAVGAAGRRPGAPPTPPAAGTREFDETQVAQVFNKFMQNLGVKTTQLNVKLSGGQMRVSIRAAEMALIGLDALNLGGTFAAQDGRLHFVLWGSPPNFPFTDYIVPGVDDAMADLVSDLQITGAEIHEGKLVVTGTGSSS